MNFCLFWNFVKPKLYENKLPIEDELEAFIDIVEKRKISYFVLARNLIQHWISPNQDDLSYSARTFFSG